MLTGVRGRDDPDGPAADYRAVRLLPGGVVVPQGLGDLAPTALTVIAVEADQLGAGSDREQGVDRLVHVRAHEVVEVALMQLDLVEPGGLENPAGGLGVTEREWPGPAGVGHVLVRAREEPLNDLLGLRPEWALGLAAPADLGEPAAGLERAADRAHSRNRCGEELRPHAREGVVVDGIPLSCLRIGGLERNVLDPRLDGLATRVLDEPRRGIGAEREASRADELSQLLSRLAEAAPDVDAAPTLGRRKELEDLLGDLCQRAHEHLAVRLPPLIQDRVPCTHRFLVGDRHRTRALLLRHRPILQLNAAPIGLYAQRHTTRDGRSRAREEGERSGAPKPRSGRSAGR